MSVFVHNLDGYLREFFLKILEGLKAGVVAPVQIFIGELGPDLRILDETWIVFSDPDEVESPGSEVAETQVFHLDHVEQSVGLLHAWNEESLLANYHPDRADVFVAVIFAHASGIQV